MLSTLVLLGAFGLGQKPPAPARPPSVVLSTDLGAEVDDQWALVHLALSPEIDLRGVITTHSPAATAPAAQWSADWVRTWLGRLPPGVRPPVLAGANTPIRLELSPQVDRGVQFLLDESRGHDASDRLVVVVIGAATDVAQTIRCDPTWADRARVVAMGFDGWPDGGDVWNVKNDRDAWRTLLSSRIPIIVGDSAITRRTLLMTPEKARTLLDGLPDPALTLRGELDAWLARSVDLARRETGSATAWPIWDEVTTAVLLGMARVEFRPRPRLGDDLRFLHEPTAATIGWVTAIDADRLWADLAAKIRRERRGPGK